MDDYVCRGMIRAGGLAEAAGATAAGGKAREPIHAIGLGVTLKLTKKRTRQNLKREGTFKWER